MQRSPITLLFFLVLSAVYVWPQTQSAEPKSASGLPQTPQSSAPAVSQSPNPAPAATGTPSGTTAPKSAGTPPSTSSASGTTSSGAASTGAKQQNNTAIPGERQLLPAPISGATATQAIPQPKTEILDSSATGSSLGTDGHDPVLDPPPLPEGITTLVGGTIHRVDRVRNKMTVKVFNGNTWTIAFDERTHIFREGAQTTPLALKKGERVYVDTMLDPNLHQILARNIRLGVAAPPADADGQVMNIDVAHGEVTLRDNISSVPVHFGVDKDTRISQGSSPVQLRELKPGALVHVQFSPENGTRGMARNISVIAAPGSAFTFMGKLTYLDTHRGLLAIQTTTDGRTYDIHFDPRRTPDADRLTVGSTVKIVATFEGTQYTAQSVQLNGSGENR
jgi:hypothetical protein